MRSHPRGGVRFEQKRRAVGGDNKIDSPPTAPADFGEGAQGEIAQFALARRRQSARANIARLVRKILRAIIVKIRRRLDANRRQRLPAKIPTV